MARPIPPPLPSHSSSSSPIVEFGASASMVRSRRLRSEGPTYNNMARIQHHGGSRPINSRAPSTSAAMLFVLTTSTLAVLASASSFAPVSHISLGTRGDLSTIHAIRGGESGDGPSAPGPYYTGQTAGPNFQSTTSSAPGDYPDAGAMGSPDDPMHEYRETVEGRIDTWRRQQQQLQQTRTAEEAANVMDENGTFKLFTTVSRASVSVFFFILMWRTVHHYELADAAFGRAASFRGALLRTIVVTPLVVLFLGEMMGAVLGLAGGRGIGGVSSSNHATKKRLKGILNLHKGVEVSMMCYNVVRLAILPSKFVPREVYIGRIISNFFFLTQAHLYTKLSWDEVSKSTIGEGYVAESYYDDITPDMTNYDGGWTEQDDFSQWQPPSTGGTEYYDETPQSQQQAGYQRNDDNATGWR